MKLKLSEIKQVRIGDLKPNKTNASYFRSEPGASERALMEDIRKRGILVPLVLRKDGTILSGHRRRFCAKHLKLKTVPAQYVLQRLTDQQEREYIIKDNLLRRHLSPGERQALYRLVCRDFDEKLLVRNNAEMGVSAREIAGKTGLNPKTVQFDITRLRRRKEKELAAGCGADAVHEKPVETYKRAIAKMLNAAIIDNAATVAELGRLADDSVRRLREIAKNRGMA
jgi:ParB-like chromosome segregation protein Spo0J